MDSAPHITAPEARPRRGIVRSLGAPALATVAVTLAGPCRVPPEKMDPTGLNFSHRFHIEEAELECTACHAAAEEEAQAGYPAEEVCTTCHEIDRGSPDESCASCHGRLDGSVDHPRPTEYEDVQFNHAAHVALEVSCLTCHAGVERSERAVDQHYPSMALCVDCHEREEAETDCAKCHARIRQDEPPQSHHLGWDASHGLLSREKDAACAYCHTDPDWCAQCHFTEKPRSHNQFWKQRAHGVEAEWDRSRCQVCHETDFCVDCHRSTAPRSHRAGWGTPPYQHCRECHEPLSATSCAACHSSVEAHFTTPPADTHRGNWAASHCNQCHLPLSATDCYVCHKTLEGHATEAPGSHGRAGWGAPRDQHCLSCHFPLRGIPPERKK